MPIIKSAKKKLRQDRKRTRRNLKVKLHLKDLVKKARRQSTADSLSAVTSALDKAVKTNLIHKNKAARLKSRLAKKQSEGPSTTSTVKRAVAKKKVVKTKAKTAKK